MKLYKFEQLIYLNRNSWNDMTMCKVFVFDRNTWNHTHLCSLFEIDRNIWNHFIFGEIIYITNSYLKLKLFTDYNYKIGINVYIRQTKKQILRYKIQHILTSCKNQPTKPTSQQNQPNKQPHNQVCNQRSHQPSNQPSHQPSNQPCNQSTN